LLKTLTLPVELYMDELIKNSIWMDLNDHLNQGISKAFKRWINIIVSFSHMVNVRQIQI